MRFLALLPLALCALFAQAPPWQVYVGDLGPRHALLAWGRPGASGNAIGRDARSYGEAELRIAGRSLRTRLSWIRAEGLEPDTRYDYDLLVGGRSIARGTLRTWPESASRLAFLVIGDYGNGSSDQYRIARDMARVAAARAGSANPVRFVLTTGDNIYATGSGLVNFASGKSDSDWWTKFFLPYAPLLASVPFFPVLGNHDGNASESRADLFAYLDNFFFPGGSPARYYSFQFADLATFFALDTTDNTASGPPRPAWSPEGEQFAWMCRQMPAARTPWKLVYMHNPIFNAGPRHEDERNESRLNHFLNLFQSSGVQAAFSGHEHNFQFSPANSRSRGIRFFVTGAGGELRPADIRSAMPAANIEGWAPAHHFLLVEIEGAAMRVTPMASDPLAVRNSTGQTIPMPVLVHAVQ